MNLTTRAFTLIELLVVITIIVVLLALLTPALDKAIYQADLAVCGTNLKGVATGVQTYAAQHKRFFPPRPGVTTPGKNWQAAMLQNGGTPAYEERRFLTGYISLNGHLNDPLTGRIDIENGGKKGVAGQSAVTAGFVYSAYARWYTWGYSGVSPNKMSLKVGDRFTWNGDAFDVLAGDWALSVTDGTKDGWGSHPDNGNAWTNKVVQDQSLGNPANPYNYTLTRWIGAGRGTLDLNFAKQDGSVSRINDVRRNDQSAGEDDERMATVPDFTDGTSPTWLNLIPLR